MKETGILFIVATPIGNLGDITFRAIEILKSADFILCEDTRVTKKLLDHYSVQAKLISYFQHSKLSKIENIITLLREGKKLALVTDAGTPGISDPGEALIAKVKQELSGAKVIPIPGPSALAAAASVSGMVQKEFFFAGFLPKKKGRQTNFKQLAALECPVIIYESAIRLERTLEEIKAYFGKSATVFIAREITKMFEEYWGGEIFQVIEDLEKHNLKGEIVLIIKKEAK